MHSWMWHSMASFQTQALDRDVSRAREESARNAERIGELEAMAERLLLISRAQWELLREFAGIDEERLAEKMREIDLRDGAEDGRMKESRIAPCVRCGRPFNRRRPRCIYCGAERDAAQGT